MRMKSKLVFLGLVLAATLTGCANKKTTSSIQKTEAPAPAKQENAPSDLSHLVVDMKKALQDSELSIHFPDEKAPGIHALQAKAFQSKISAQAMAGQKEIFNSFLTAAEYKRLLDYVKKTTVETSTKDDFSNCRDPYRLVFRLENSRSELLGCRGAGTNATLVSKLARELEFLLIRHSSR